jgi:carboxypeptidase Taq
VSAPPALEQLKTRVAEIDDLGGISQLLFWDQQTKMPPLGSAARAEQAATLTRITHERFVSDEVGRLLQELQPYEESLSHDSDDAALIRVTRRDWEKAMQVPPALSAEMRRAGSLALRAWGDARPRSDFEALRPHLETNLELRHRYVECFDPAEETYDVLLDDYDPGLRTSEVRAVFARLKEALVPLIRAVASDGGGLGISYDREKQTAFALRVLGELGFEEESWRLDPTPHPFMQTPGYGDVRITTYYDDTHLISLFAAMHEFGHGIYERRVDPALARTPLASGASMSLHESQSRMWENLVGRGRPFWRRFFPQLRGAFPALDGVDEETFYRSVNVVRPSLIRVDADEVTYTMHIILRFELEQDLIEGRLQPAELPERWNALMEEYLGIDVPSDADGVLQDMHWASGLLGYFPTYALGNVMSVQIWDNALRSLPELPEQIERGEFAPLRDWLTEHLYRHGRKFTPAETLELAAGGPLDPEPYIAYLTEKHGR